MRLFPFPFHSLIPALLAVGLATPLALRAQAPAGAAKGQAVVLPERFLRGFDPITVFFPSDTGPAAGGPEDQPGKVLRLAPVAPGEYRWTDARTLVFRPAVPWPALETYHLTVGSVTRTLRTLIGKPVRTLPAEGAKDLESIEEFTLTFADPVPKERLARMVGIEVRPLPGLGEKGARRLSAEDFTVKALERASLTAPASYVLRLKQPILGGYRVLLKLRLAADEKLPDSHLQLAYSTRVPFRVVAAGCAAGLNLPAANEETRREEGEREGNEDSEGEEAPNAPPASASPAAGLLPLSLSGSRYSPDQAIDGGTEAPRIVLQFSAEPAPLSLSAVKALVRFSPAIPELTYTQSGAFLTLQGRLDRDVSYRVEIRPVPLRDTAGRMLQMGGPSEFHVFFPRQSPFLKWAQAEGLLERFGPQMFPLSGRGEAAVDLRIHRIDPLDRGLWPFPRNPVSIDEHQRPPGPGEEPAPGSSLEGYIEASHLAQRLRLLGSPQVSRIVPLPLRSGGGATTFGLPLKEALAHIAGPEQPGTYLLGIRRLNEQTTREYVRIQVTDLCLTTVEEPRAVLFLVTSLRTGKPVPGATVTVEGTPKDAKDPKAWVPLLSGTTDGEGRFRAAPELPMRTVFRRIHVKSGGDTLVLQPSDPPHAFANNHWTGPSGAWLEWLNRSPEAQDEAVLLAHLFTERPVYRPEEPVYLKGYLRLRDKGRLRFAPAEAYEVAVTDPSEKERTYPVEMTEAGSFHLTFAENDLPTGTYKATLRRVSNPQALGSVDWKMEAYRVPRFEVKLHGPEWAPMDREFTLTATAAYFAGGKVVGQDVRWRVTQFPHVHVPERREGWLFSSDERFSRGGRFEPAAALEKRDKTDENGSSRLSVNPALELDARPRKYVFEATVTGADDQTVTAVKEVRALPPFLLGLKVERFIQGGKVIRPSILALDGENRPKEGQEVTLRLLSRKWHSHLKETDFSQGKARYVTEVVEEPILERKVLTAADPVSLELPVPEGGIYVVELASRDALGRLQLVLVDLYVAGDEPLSWKKPRQNVFETATDKKEYGPGETAQILLKSPFQQAEVLAVVEGPDGNAYHRLELLGGKAVFALPLRNEYHPRIPVHFVLMRGRLPGRHTEGTLDLGKPATVAATQWVKVNPEANKVLVKLEHPPRALPGQKITVKMHLRDAGGKPLAGEVTLALVDLAVLSLGKEKRLDPLPSFIQETRTRITIRDTRNRVLGEILADEHPGGDGSEEDGSDLLGKVTVRKRFKTVPYYNPRILVDASGDAEVTFELSDDLTVFKVKAVACSGPDRFGAAQSQIAVRLPVIVQPALPRFARLGDAFRAGGIGRIVEGEGGPGRAQIQVQGGRVEGESTRMLEWAKDRPERLYFPMRIEVPKGDGPAELNVKLAVRRDRDGAADAFETRIPVLPDRDPVSVQVFKRLQDGSLAFPAMKEAPRPGSVRQSVLVSDQEALLKMMSGLDYLFEYPHGCTEQFVSRSYPAVALKGLYKTLDMKAAQAKTDALVAETLDALGKTLQPDGLYAFWPGGRGYVHLTAYVAEFLLEARKSGYTFDPKLLERPLGALKEALRSDYARFLDGEAFTERADALCVLAKAGQFDPAYGSELTRKAQTADLYAESRILLAYQAAQAGAAGAESLRKRLWDGTVFKLQEGREVYGGLQSRSRGWGGLGLASEVRTQATLLRALHSKDSANPRFRMILDDLVASGTGDGWGNTSTNAAALLALRDVVRGRREGAPAREFRVEFGDQAQVLKLGPDRSAASASSAQDVPGRLVALSGPRDGVVARLGLVYTPQSTGDHVAARSEGFVVRREVIRVAPEGTAPMKEWIEQEGKTLACTLGEVLEEHIQVVNPEDRHYVAVVAPFAAGLEPLNPALATAPKEAQPAGRMTLKPSYAQYLDSEVRFYFETLPKGTYDFYYRLKASTPGAFTHPAARAEMMYQTQKRGNSPGTRVEVKEKGD